MSDVVLVCKACYEEGRGFVRPVYEKLENGAQQVCPTCHAVVMWYSDMGKLDLGLIEQTNPDDFEILKPPW